MFNIATNDFADDLDFVFYGFNQRARSSVAQGVKTKIKPGSANMERLQALINDTSFLTRIYNGIKNPQHDDAKDVFREILPLINIVGQNIPFAEAGASNKALSEMMNLHRFFGTWAYFFTCNPVMQDYPLALRISGGVTDNWTDLNGEYFDISPISIERRRVIERSPIGASYTYNRLYKSVYEHLIGFPQAEIGGTLKSTLLPHKYRDIKRGIFGEASAYFIAQELSKAKVQHWHSLIIGPTSWRFFKSLNLEDPSVNLQVGNYFDSIITTHLPLDPDNMKEWLPITKSKWNSDPNIMISETPADPNDPKYEIQFNYIASHKQDHFNHNFSCWKFNPKRQKDLTTCRFAMPFHSWDQESGMYQLALVQAEVPKKTRFVKILSKIGINNIPQVNRFSADNRLIVPILYRPSIANAQKRTHKEMREEKIINEKLYHNDCDPLGRNGFLTDFSKPVTMATYGAQNNVQIADGGLGSPIYISKYIAKGSCLQLNSILPLLADAIEVSKDRPSNNQDNQNPDVVAHRLMNRFVNNQARHFEASSRLCISKCLGMTQYESSHSFAYIYIWSAIKDMDELQITNVINVDLGIDFDNPTHNYGELVKTSDEKLIMVSSNIDYKYRSHELKDYNILEVLCITNKNFKKIPKLKIGKNQMGRKVNGFFNFTKVHPQHDTHKLSLSSRLKIPFLAGEFVPGYPAVDKNGIRDEIELNRFGAYFLVLLCPWSLTTLKPPFELSYQGLLDYMETLDFKDPIDYGRYQYIQNCTDCMGGVHPNKVGKDSLFQFRKRSATTYGEFKKNISLYNNLNHTNEEEEENEDKVAEDNQIGISTSHKHCHDSGEQKIEEEGKEIIDILLHRFQQDVTKPPNKSKMNQMYDDKKMIESLLNIITTRVDIMPSNSSGQEQFDLTMDARLINTCDKKKMEKMLILMTEEEMKLKWIELLKKPHSKQVSKKERRHQHKIKRNTVALIETKVLNKMNTKQALLYKKFILASQNSDIVNKNKSQLIELLLGPPGTGKSYIIEKIVGLFLDDEYMVCASSAKAAMVFENLNATTVHSIFNLGIKKKISNLSVGLQEAMLLTFENVRLIVIDEIFMLDSTVFGLVDQRLKELFQHDEIRKNMPFAGIHILLSGDWDQLPAIGISLVKATLEGGIPGNLMRRACMQMFKEQMRSQDPSHSKMIEQFNDTTIQHPITIDMLRQTCEHCWIDGSDTKRKPDCMDHELLQNYDNCPVYCTHRCLHFKVLTREDINQDPKWNFHSMRFVTCLNSTADSWNLSAMRYYAIQNDVPIVKFRLKLKNKKQNSYAHIILSDQEAENYYDLWGYFVHNAPVFICANINVDKSIGNGTAAYLDSIVWGDMDRINSENKKIASYETGNIITLECPPKAFNVRLKKCNTIITLPYACSRLHGFVDDVKIAGNLIIKVINCGYKLAFGVTIHGVQGQNEDHILLNANYSPNFRTGLTLNAFYVAYTRVKRAADIRFVPWLKSNPNELTHLLQLEHNDDVQRLLKCYGEDGYFDLRRLTEAKPIKIAVKRIKNGKTSKLIKKTNNTIFNFKQEKSILNGALNKPNNKSSQKDKKTQDTQDTQDTQSRLKLAGDMTMPTIYEAVIDHYSELIPDINYNNIWTCLVNWGEIMSVSSDGSVKLELRVIPYESTETDLLGYHNNVEQCFCIEMFLIYKYGLPQKNPSASIEEYLDIIYNHYFTCIATLLNTDKMIDTVNRALGRSRYLNIYRMDSKICYEKTKACGLCGYRACIQLEKRFNYLFEKYGRICNIPENDYAEINEYTNKQDPDFSNDQTRNEVGNDIERRDTSLSARIACMFIRHERMSNCGPFFPENRGGWFDVHKNFIPWCENSTCIGNKLLANVMIMDDRVSQDNLAQVHISSFEGETPYAFENIKEIVASGSYLLLSKSLNHFGVQPMTNTNKEMLTLNLVFDDLCKTIAKTLIYHYKQDDYFS